ncbi:MAG: hypothetical protein ACLSDQ_05330 [Adlercreutzia equolifaciens]
MILRRNGVMATSSMVLFAVWRTLRATSPLISFAAAETGGLATCVIAFTSPAMVSSSVVDLLQG